MSMPGMRGDKLATEILAIRPDVPVILCTGYSKQISEEKAEEIGIRAFVMKPLTRHELTNTVRKVLDEGALHG
jgi:CheY-like chemotaxis protein